MEVSTYETDYSLWKLKQIEALAKRDWNEVDIEHLIEDLEMGDPRKTLESNLLILLAHLIKLQVQNDAPDLMKQSWYNSIVEHRARITNELEASGTLRRYFPQAVHKAYPKARNLAIQEGKQADGRKVKQPRESDYPLTLPQDWEDKLLDLNWWPN